MTPDRAARLVPHRRQHCACTATRRHRRRSELPARERSAPGLGDDALAELQARTEQDALAMSIASGCS